MNTSAFSIINRMRCEAPDGFNHKLTEWSLSDWMTAITGEVGEAANIVKKLNRVRDGIAGNSETEAELKAKLARELADVFVYLDLTFQRLGMDLGATVAEVFNAKSEKFGSPLRV
jgi:NTP pyrophosphatase (non-canonical NTP hydrolase)